ncbi:cytochrome c oxidase assembly protein [Gracilibacillus dipsosauri]|uniref:Cytochrome c oxidase assembly protein n=1 Tax=Gracilibacillus dipsosauri TaxID=178340 RepID=A0A317KZR3_9BACI|nr:cytochrome c oxidase assembly protein [Gracilibacillus dipsosauri]
MNLERLNKVNKNYRLLLLLISLVTLLTACGNKYEGDFSFEIEDFTYTNQDGEEFSKSDLEGEFWVASMIFTNCNTVCPPMTSNMVRLQGMLADANIDAQLVSFSVDPEVDTPELLKQYAAERGASFDNWNLLTGYTYEEIKEFVKKSFKAPLEKLEDDQYMHTTRFYIVTPEGNAIKAYDGSKAANMEKIVEDIQAMN